MTVPEAKSSPERPKIRDGRIAVAVYLEPEMYDALKARARRTERSMTWIVERALKRHLRESKKAA